MYLVNYLFWKGKLEHRMEVRNPPSLTIFLLVRKGSSRHEILKSDVNYLDGTWAFRWVLGSRQIKAESESDFPFPLSQEQEVAQSLLNKSLQIAKCLSSCFILPGNFSPSVCLMTHKSLIVSVCTLRIVIYWRRGREWPSIPSHWDCCCMKIAWLIVQLFGESFNARKSCWCNKV